MKRREFLQRSATLSFAAVVSPNPAGGFLSTGDAPGLQSHATTNPLTPPAHGPIHVAFLVSEGTVMIDLAGPWQVFTEAMVPSRGTSMDDQMPFQTYAVAEQMNPVQVSGGLKIQPQYTFADAPAPRVVVIPAQSEPSKATLEWIRACSKTSDVTMSVCTGARILAATGLLSGKPATTHHGAYRTFAADFPDVIVKRGVRYVETGNLASSGGLSSGIDLALRVVERYFGRNIAANTAYELEYQGRGWIDPNTNAVYLKQAVSTKEHPLCPVCSMEVSIATAPKSVYKGNTYYFCSESHKETFDAAPAKWI